MPTAKKTLKTQYEEWVQRCADRGLTDTTIQLLELIAQKDPRQTWKEFAADVKRNPSYIRRLRVHHGDLINDYAQQFLFNRQMPDWFKALDKKCRAGDVQALKLAFELEGKLKRELEADHVIIVEHHIPRAETPSENES